MRKLLFVLVSFVLFNTSYAQNKPYSNPMMIYGSSFGNFFQALYKTADFNKMMNFTSSESIKKYGYENILKYYKSLDFYYEIKLKSRTVVSNDRYVLNYITVVNNTNHNMRLTVIVENDSTKIVLDSILFNPGISVKNFKNYGASIK